MSTDSLVGKYLGRSMYVLSFLHSITKMPTESLMGLGRAWQLCGYELQKNTSRKKLKYSVGGI